MTEANALFQEMQYRLQLLGHDCAKRVAARW
jgi:hypothetical protein